jgi:hypothetical protein
MRIPRRAEFSTAAANNKTAETDHREELASGRERH